VPLYDGAAWALYSIGTQLSQTTSDTTKSPAAVANNSNYDLFVWNDSGTVRLSRGTAWSSDTARGTGAGTTELEKVNGRYVNKVSISNGPGAQRGLYVGTVRSDGSAQINDSLAKRHVWNAHNRVSRPMRVTESTNSWNYATATFRQANGSAANQLDVVRGLDEDAVTAHIQVGAIGSQVGSAFRTAIGLDSTTSPATGCLYTYINSDTTTSGYKSIPSQWIGLPGIGRHYLAWLEKGPGGGTAAFVGDTSADAAAEQAGIHGTMLA